MNTLEKLMQEIAEALPGTEMSLDRPAKQSAPWWLDLRRGDRSAVVEWREGKGFGVSTPTFDSLGEGSHEVYEKRRDATQRLLQLLRTEARTQPRDIVLRALREEIKVSQEKLADLLGISQAAVSNIERRGDVRLSTLRRVIRAYGGEVEVLARIGGEEFRLQIPESGNPVKEMPMPLPPPPMPARRPLAHAGRLKAKAGKAAETTASNSPPPPARATRPQALGDEPWEKAKVSSSRKGKKSSRRAPP